MALPCLNWSISLGSTTSTSALLTSALCLHFAYPKDQAGVPNVRLFYFSCSTTLFLTIRGQYVFLRQHTYFNTPLQLQRHIIRSTILVQHCYCCKEYGQYCWFFPSPLSGPAGVTLAAVMNRCLFLACLSVQETSEVSASVPAVSRLQIGFSDFFSSQSVPRDLRD